MYEKQNDKNCNNVENVINDIDSFFNVVKNYCRVYESFINNSSEYILNFLDFGNWFSATQKLIENQIVFTDDLTSSLVEEINGVTDVEKVITDYYFEDNDKKMNELIHRCKQSKCLDEYQELYSQIVSAYRMEHYRLAIIGLFSLFDGVLADVSHMIKETGYKKRLKQVKDKVLSKIELNAVDRKLIYVSRAIFSFDNSLFCNSCFDKKEPNYPNRHWIVHGRSRRIYDKIDFLKVLLWLDAVIFLADKDI